SGPSRPMAQNRRHRARECEAEGERSWHHGRILLQSRPTAIIHIRTMAIVPGTRLGPYEVVGPLGAGGMGEVYAARDTRLDRPVAVKVLPASVSTDPQFRSRFDREARAIAALNDPHICTL